MKEHITVQSVTWDQIALDEYGSELSTQAIMAENGTRDPELLSVWRFPQGVSIAVPDLPADASSVSTLPEYRRP